MSDGAERAATGAGDRVGARRAWRLAGAAAGAALLVLALAAVWRERSTIDAALRAAGTPSPGRVLLLVACVVLNVVASGLVFSLLTARYGRVGIVEMQAITAASALLNYLPLRPGLVARVAWHRAAHGIRPVHAVAVVLQALALSSAIAAWLVIVVLVSSRFGAALWPGVLAPLPVLGAVATVRRLRAVALAALVRYLELLVWALRYHLAFALVGLTITPSAALAFACASIVATLVPLVPNGLGLREWAVGLLAPLLASQQVELGMTAELVNRGVEVVTIGVLGGTAIAWLDRRRRRARA